jgi:cephalosporin-C deacetylase-like acetyl esterase
VDGDRVGVSGCSGGGTLTAYIAAVDDRIKAAAPSCYITSWQDQLKGTGPQDAEQQFPDQFLESFDLGDLIIAAAPKPYLILATTEDYFPIAGAKRTFEDMKRLYDRFGAEDKIGLFVAPGGHGMRADTRAAVYGWMRKWLRNESGEILPEPSFQVEFEEDLNATETGQVSTSLGGETASTLNIRRFAPLRPASGDVREAVRRLTRIVYSPGVPATEVVASSDRDGVRAETIRYEAEDGRYVPAILYRPNATARGTALVVDAAGKSSTAAAELAASGYNVLVIDSALTGETASKISSYAAEWFPHDKPTWLALMTGRTVTGLRMTDILKGLDLLESRTLAGQGGVTGLGIGNPGVSLLHAAVIDHRISRVVLDGMPASYRSMATTPVQKRIFDVVIPGVLRHYDLAQLAASVAPREVIIGNAMSPLGQVLGVREATAVFSAKNVKVLRRREAETFGEIYFPKH